METYQSKQEKQHDPIQTMSTHDANHLQTYKPQDLRVKISSRSMSWESRRVLHVTDRQGQPEADLNQVK